MSWGFCLLLLVNSLLFAAEPKEETHLLPPAPIYANWMFSGLVANESGENYGYFFQIKRERDHFYALSALFDAQSKQLIFSDESEAVIPDSTPYNWHVGRAFMRFNTINNSWIFGLKSKDNKGFNFKVDMLKRSGTLPMVQSLRPGVQLLVNQTTHLNGHIQTGDENKEQFVTAKNAWFRQIWLAEHHDKRFPFSGILCQLNNGTGFYSVKMTEKLALRPGIVKWFDEQGNATDMARAVKVKPNKKEGLDIYIFSPKLHLVLTEAIKNQSVTAGFMNKDKPGFCVLSTETLASNSI